MLIECGRRYHTPSIEGSPPSRVFTSTSARPPASCGCRSRFPTLLTPSSSPGSLHPQDETSALWATRALQVMGMPAGDSVLEYRDRALLKFFSTPEPGSPPPA